MNTLNNNKPGFRRHDNLKKYHGVSGVYLIYTGGMLYVGSTKDLRSRLRTWSCECPGAKFAAYPCSDYRAQEQRLYEKYRSMGLKISNQNNPVAVRLSREPRPRNPNKKYKPPGPGRIPDRKITVAGITRTLSAWCTLNQIDKRLFYARLALGWTEQQAIGRKRR